MEYKVHPEMFGAILMFTHIIYLENSILVLHLDKAHWDKDFKLSYIKFYLKIKVLCVTKIICFGGIDNLQRGPRWGEIMGQRMHMKHYMSSFRPEKKFYSH